MTIRYWGVQLPDETCQEVLSRLTVPAFRGADLGQILQVVKEVLGETSEFTDEDPLQTKVEDFDTSKKLTTSESEATRVSLQQDVYHAKAISSLKEAFRPTKPIPQIVIYDDFMAEYNEEGSAGHACIIEGLNFDTKFVYLIDPKAQKRKKAGYLSFDDFEKGWRVFEQTTIMIYPAAFYLAHRNITNTLGMREK